MFEMPVVVHHIEAKKLKGCGMCVLLEALKHQLSVGMPPEFHL